jgi:hypothetical protein
VGGRTLGVRAQASRKHLEWSFLGSELWVVESACKGQVVCKGSSINKGKEQRRKSSTKGKSTYPKGKAEDLQFQSTPYIYIHLKGRVMGDTTTLFYGLSFSFT